MSLLCLPKCFMFEINNNSFGIKCDHELEEIGFYTIIIDVVEDNIEVRTLYGLICIQLPYEKDCFLGGINYDLKEEGIPTCNRNKVLEFLAKQLEEIYYNIVILRGVSI